MTPRRQLGYWLLGVAVVGALLFVLRGVLLPFVAGMAVAYFLDPVVDRLESWKMSRTFATSVVMVLFCAVIAIVVVLLAPIVVDQVLGIARQLPRYFETVRDFILPLVNEGLSTTDGKGVREAVAGMAFEAVDIIGKVLRGLWSGGLALINIVSLLLITPVAAFYLLRDWDHIVARVDSWLPRQQAEVIRQLVGEIDRVLSAWVRGTGSVCLMLGVFYAAGLSLAGLEFGLIVGLGAGLISFVPFVGSVTGLVVSGGLALAQFWPDHLHILLVIGVFVVGQILEGNLLTPYLVGDKVGLHPVWVIFALLAGGTLFGFVGVLLALPAAAAFGVLVRFGMGQYLKSELFWGPGQGPPADGGGATGG